MKVWITTYALTDGIKAVDAEWSSVHPSMVSYRPEGISLDRYVHGEGKDWHRTPESAEQRVEQMRAKRIASLKKNLAALESMEIKAPKGD